MSKFRIGAIAIAVSCLGTSYAQQEIQGYQTAKSNVVQGAVNQPSGVQTQSSAAPAQQPVRIVSADAVPPVPPIGSGLPKPEFSDYYNHERPLSPEQIQELRKLKDRLDRAGSKRPNGMPQPVSSARQISLSPGVVPLPIRLDVDTVSSIVFTDITGAPWPIADFGAGSKTSLNLPEVKDVVEKGMNVLTISPADFYVSTNLSVLLKGANAPIVFAIVSGQKKVDYRLDVIAQARGPNALAVIADPGFTSGLSIDIQNVLDGTLGDKAKELTVSGDSGARAWQIGDEFYVRTRMAVVSPAAISSGRSADGMRVFRIPKAPTVTALSDGKFVTLKISGY